MGCIGFSEKFVTQSKTLIALTPVVLIGSNGMHFFIGYCLINTTPTNYHVTDPSTHGVYEERIDEICTIIHDNWGQVTWMEPTWMHMYII